MLCASLAILSSVEQDHINRNIATCQIRYLCIRLNQYFRKHYICDIIRSLKLMDIQNTKYKTSGRLQSFCTLALFALTMTTLMERIRQLLAAFVGKHILLMSHDNFHNHIES